MRTLKIFLFLIVIIACGSVPMYQAIRTDATLTGAGTTDSPLGVNRGTELTPASITSDKDDFDPAGWDAASYVRLDGDNGIRAITSFAAPDASTSPQEKTLLNIGSYPIYFPGEHPDGTAANRIITDRDFILYPKQSCKIVYDGTSTRWRIVGEENTEGKTGVFFTNSSVSTIAGDFSNVGMQSINSGSLNNVQGTTSMPSALQIRTEALTNGGYILFFAKGVFEYTAFASAHLYVETILSVPTLSDGTNTYTLELQLAPSPSSSTLENNNTVGIRYSNGINGGEWELFSQDNAAAESVADLNVVVATATRYKLGIWIDKSKTEARAYINDSYVGRVTGNLPNSVICGSRVIVLKSAGTTNRSVNVHNFSAGAIYP
jgi:hypothetical protein